MDIQLRGACVAAGDKIRIKLNNLVLTIVNLPNTGGFQNWETVTIEDIRIPAGEDQILRITLTYSANKVTGEALPKWLL